MLPPSYGKQKETARSVISGRAIPLGHSWWRWPIRRPLPCTSRDGLLLRVLEEKLLWAAPHGRHPAALRELRWGEAVPRNCTTMGSAARQASTLGRGASNHVGQGGQQPRCSANSTKLFVSLSRLEAVTSLVQYIFSDLMVKCIVWVDTYVPVGWFALIMLLMSQLATMILPLFEDRLLFRKHMKSCYFRNWHVKANTIEIFWVKILLLDILFVKRNSQYIV